jgi:hypothetical protein
MAYKANKAANDHDQDDYQAQSDADTLQRHAEIHADPDRLAAAHDHLGKKLQNTQDAHRAARKALGKKVKGKLKQVFGDKNANTFEDEKSREAAAANQVVSEKE